MEDVNETRFGVISIMLRDRRISQVTMDMQFPASNVYLIIIQIAGLVYANLYR